MALLAASRLLLDAPDLAFGLLLVATGALGLGFGATVMALNLLRRDSLPGQRGSGGPAAQRAAGLGHGARAGAGGRLPVVIGAWWLLPGVVACILVLIFAIALTQPLGVSSRDRPVRRLSHDQ